MVMYQDDYKACIDKYVESFGALSEAEKDEIKSYGHTHATFEREWSAMRLYLDKIKVEMIVNGFITQKKALDFGSWE